MFGIASSTALISSTVGDLAGGVYTVISDVLPYLIGFTVLFMGLAWVKRAIHG